METVDMAKIDLIKTLLRSCLSGRLYHHAQNEQRIQRTLGGVTLVGNASPSMLLEYAMNNADCDTYARSCSSSYSHIPTT